MYIIIKLLSYYYYVIIIFFLYERKGLDDPVLVPNKPNIIIINQRVIKLSFLNLYILNYIALSSKLYTILYMNCTYL